MRIVAGRWGGRRVVAPSGAAPRPPGHRGREALFSILGPRVEGARVLDLFAGSGALGLEALSRGAAEATFGDSAPAAIAPGRANLGAPGRGAQGRRAGARGAPSGVRPGGAARRRWCSPAGPPGRLGITSSSFPPRHTAWRRA